MLAIALQTNVVSADNLPQGFEYLASGKEHESLVRIRSNAIYLIRQASKNEGNNLNAHAVDFGEKVIEQLNMSKFAISTNESSEKRCGNSDMFVNPSFPNVIFVCGHTRTAINSGVARNHLVASQILIHEGAHLVDYAMGLRSKECRATYFELAIMENNFGKKNIPTMGNRDTYKRMCGFEEYDDVPKR